MNLRLIHFFLLLTPAILLAKADRYNRDVIKQYALNPQTVYNIPIGNTPTTITFPGPLSSIDGANVSSSAKNKAPVLLSYIDGRYFFSVRATEPNARGALNVVFQNQTFVFNFYHHEDEIPYRTVRLVDSGDSAMVAAGYGAERTNIHKTTPSVLLDLPDRAKSYHLINQAYPKMLDEEIQHLAPPNLNTEYQDFNVRIDDIYRFPQYDTLAFKISLRNESDEAIFYQPQMMAVRIGQNLYFPSIADASGIIPPQSDSIAYIAITGKPNGERADLSIRNPFQIIVSQVNDPATLLIP
ncbi:hypothetical protein [Ruficoccus sp. ZRK36]|uniref:hypothetical protein n=1 Tax=Ruficoccus sp. ZRK36 TaxID=2866311 RepID=UPI001C73BAFC|nr:hypothetical protein [Ruficoccus sp. ZRK36]QYY35490.1 hypothetical protein K0V07_14475 [Ruficoccus sp. ZRK36]